MNIVLTGHTKDIGKSVYEFLVKAGHNVHGCSSSNDYNILTMDGRSNVLNLFESSDVLINNACVRFAQTELLDEAVKRFYDTDKKIINIGSLIAEVGLPESSKYLSWLERYYQCKLSLKQKYEELKSNTMNLQLEYVSFSYVLTPTIMEKYPEGTPKPAISLQQAVDLILEKL